MKKSRYPIIVAPFLKVAGIALFPFILVSNKQLLEDEVLMRHETIHLKQEAELLVIPFYLLYALSYCINFVRYRNHSRAYEMIWFEREAYANEYNTDYLYKRKLYAWINYVK
ncbi:hypothetical protein GSY63_08590 [Mucilaginibacter sp. R11]|uniref:Uncharacterized protein n=2 Tax=Mucilaginibacter agri TaxID=2695265 RepID=A0A965ZET5_9SPHI|nr:hypothetical protein [Mucilaginibacter agri]